MQQKLPNSRSQRRVRFSQENRSGRGSLDQAKETAYAESLVTGRRFSVRGNTVMRSESWAMCLPSCVWLFVTLWTADCQPSRSMQFRQEEYWSGVAISFSKGSSWPKDQTFISRVACITGEFFTTETPELGRGGAKRSHKPQNMSILFSLGENGFTTISY